MKDLVFSIAYKNHTFNIKATPRSMLCSYYNKGNYVTSLIFASNTYASVDYKNVGFRGAVTKRDNWYVSVNYRTVVKKHYHNYYFLSEKSSLKETENKLVFDKTKEYPDRVLWLYGQMVEFLQEYYRCIEDKERFKEQLCEILASDYSDEGIEDLDTVVEYENWDNVGPDEDPIIEKRSLKDVLVEDCQEFFVCFRQSEIDSKNKEEILALENVIKETPSLLRFPYELLQKEFYRFLDKNGTDLIKPNIWHYQKEVLLDIAEELTESCQYILFIDAVEEKIDNILLWMGVEHIDKDELYSYFKMHYDQDRLPSDEEFEIDVRKFVNEQVEFQSIYNKYVSLFNNDYIKIEWDDEKLSLFQKYDKEEQIIDPKNLAEYEVYKYVMPFYKKHFLRKNSNQYRPIIEKLPAFTSYGSAVLDILFKHKVIVDNGETVVYNDDGNTEMAYKEIDALEGNF